DVVWHGANGGATRFMRSHVDLITPGRQLQARQEADTGTTDTLAGCWLEAHVELLPIAALHAGALVRRDNGHLDLFVEAPVALVELERAAVDLESQEQRAIRARALERGGEQAQREIADRYGFAECGLEGWRGASFDFGF